MGLFKLKKKPDTPPKLICRVGDLGSYKCVLLAAYRNVPIQIEWINPSSVEDKVSDSLKFSELDRYPVIQDGEFTVCGSNAAMTYLNIKGGAPSVHPRKARVLAIQQYWIQVLNSKFAHLVSDVDKNKDAILSIIEIFDQALEDKSHIVGEFSLADIHWFAVFNFLEKERVMMLSNYKNVNRWLASIKKEFPDFESKIQQIAA